MKNRSGGRRALNKNGIDDRMKERLRGAGLKATPVRVFLLKTLIDAKQPMSVEELTLTAHSRLRGPRRPDLVTIYRSVNAFMKAGLIGSVNLGIGRILYEMRRDEASHYHHVMCDRCHVIEPLDLCGLESITRILKKRGYQNLQHNLEFRGICKRCS